MYEYTNKSTTQTFFKISVDLDTCDTRLHWAFKWFEHMATNQPRLLHSYRSTGGVVVKLLVCGERGPGSIPGLAATISPAFKSRYGRKIAKAT